MSHDIHFLSRLSRVAQSQVDLSLALYRDPLLVREVLNSAQIPEGAERVAISLADPVEGPFLVVARNGHFVTCLGAGMRTDDLPLITRAKLDSVASRLATMRERLELAARVAEGGRTASSLPMWDKVLATPERLSREDVAGLAVWMPMILPLAYEYVTTTHEKMRRVLPRLARRRGDPTARRQLLLLHVRAVLARVVLVQLVLANGRGFANILETPDAVAYGALALLTVPVGDGLLPSLACALNGMSIGGKEWVAGLKREDRGPFRDWCLVGIALAHDKVRAEVTKFLSRAGKDRQAETELLEHREEEAARRLQLVRESVWGDLVEWHPDVAARFGRPEELPAHYALPLLLQAPITVNDEPFSKALWWTLPLTARARPEDLHLPAELVRPASEEELVDFGERLVSERAQWMRQQPVTAPVVPGRNDPCSCGSGKKYKKCCES